MSNHIAYAESNQTPMDLAMQCYANPEALPLIIQAAGIANLTDPIATDTPVAYYETTDELQREGIRRGVRVATGDSVFGGSDCRGEFDEGFSPAFALNCAQDRFNAQGSQLDANAANQNMQNILELLG